MHREQRQKTTELLKARGVERALFAHLDTVKWLTGFAPPVQMGWHHLAGGPALVWFEGDHYYLIVLDAHAIDAGDFDQEVDGTLLTYQGYTIEQPIASAQNLAAALGDLLKRSAGYARHVGVEMQSVPAALFDVLASALAPNVTMTRIDDWLVPLRAVKTEEELVKLRRNFALTDIGHAAALEAIRPGLREIDIWMIAQTAINREAGRRVPLGNDCVVGDRPQNIGAWPRDYELKADGSLILDLSTGWQGYWSDSCETYYPVEMTPKQAAVRRVVREALDYAVGLIRPGVVAKDVDQKVRQFIEKAGYTAYPHHTGHGVGAGLHEAPRIVPYNDEILQAGMVIMLEPGIYFPGETGVRLEDGLLVTVDGAEVLTKHTRP